MGGGTGNGGYGSVPEDPDEIEEFLDWRTVYDGDVGPYPPIPAEVRKRVGARLRDQAGYWAGIGGMAEQMNQDADLIDPPSNPPVDDSVPSVQRSPENGVTIYRLGDSSDEPAYMAAAPGDVPRATYTVYDPMLSEPQEEPLVNPSTNPDDDARTENDWLARVRNTHPPVTGTHAPLDLRDDDIDTVVKALVAVANHAATDAELSAVKALIYILDHGGSDRDPVLGWEPIDRGDGSEVPVDGQYVIRLATEARIADTQLSESRSSAYDAEAQLAKVAGRLRQRG